MSFFIILFIVSIMQTAQSSYDAKFLSITRLPLLEAPLPDLPLFPLDGSSLYGLKDSNLEDTDAAQFTHQNYTLPDQNTRAAKKRQRQEKIFYNPPQTLFQHCPVCLELFPNLEQVADHIAQNHLGKKLKNMHHKANQALLARCVLQKIAHDGKNMPYEKEQIMKKCPDYPCNYSSTEMCNVRRHWVNRHLLKTSLLATPNHTTDYLMAATKLIPQSLMRDPELVFDTPIVLPQKSKPRQNATQCPVCFRIFSTQRSFKRHYNGFHNNMKPSCSTCGNVYSNQESCLRHIIMVHLLCGQKNKQLFPFVCSLQECKKRLATKRQLVKHFVNYHGLRKSTLPDLKKHTCIKSWQTLRQKAYEFLQKPKNPAS